MKTSYIANLSIILYFAFSTCAALAQENCDRYVSNMEQVECISKNIKELDKELNSTYQAALAAMPESDTTDSRKGRDQLKKSQRAWLKYSFENCALIGGIEGGSNLWVTHFSGLCYADAVAERIKFLKGIANAHKP